MTRVISVFLPTLSTDRVRRRAGAIAPPAETPLILVGRDGRRRVVDAAAQAAGLRVGMPATKAQALVQGLVIQDADPAADAEALDRLASWMLQRFAPIIAADVPGWRFHQFGGNLSDDDDRNAFVARKSEGGRVQLAGDRLVMA
jgi:protein ImuB